MKKIFYLSKVEYKRRWVKPTIIILYIITPVLISFIMWVAFGGMNLDKISPLKIAIVNKDKEGIVSNFFVNGFKGMEDRGFIQSKIVNEKIAKDLIEKRKVSAILIVPENFSKDILNYKKTELILIKNPSEVIYPMIAEEGIVITKDIINYFLTIFEDEIEVIKDVVVGKEDISVNRIYKSSEKKFRKILKIIMGEIIVLDEKQKEEQNENLAIYFFPGMSFFFLFFISNAFLFEIVKERKKFILKRMFLSGLKESEYYFSKIFGSLIILLLIEFLLSILGYYLFKIKVCSIFWLAVSLVLSALILVSFSALIMGISKNERGAQSIGMVFVFSFSIAGGALVPVRVLPESFRVFSHISPFYYITESIISISLSDMGRFFYSIKWGFVSFIILFLLGYCFNIKILKRILNERNF